jgi:3-hydroxyisobutyrate dehydrogenase
MHIGIAGLGRMGTAIAERLKECGHTLTVWNRSPNKTKPLAAAGAAVAATPAELASRVDTIITILTDAAAIDAVYGGPSGLLAGDVAGKLFVEMSTVQPEIETALAPKVRAKGAAFVECPVGGTTGPARQGKLVGMAGGEAADVARAKPVLDQLCRRLDHCGPVGTATAMKLAINLPLLISYQALGEALSLCRQVGLSPEQLVDLLGDSSGGTNALKARAGVVAKLLKGEDAGPAGFDVDGGLKDLRTMLAEGKARGIDLPMVEAAIRTFEEAKTKGLGSADGFAVSTYWRSRK